MIDIINEICRTLNITYDELMKLNAKEIEELANKRQEEEIAERIKNGEKEINMLKLIVKDWDVLASYIGEEELIRQFAKHRKLSDYFTSTYSLPDCLKHLSEEQQELFRVSSSGSRYYILSTYYSEDAIKDALLLWNKNLSCYSLTMYRYDGINTEVSFSIEMENFMGDKKTNYHLSTTLFSVLQRDINMIINDVLDRMDFHKIVNKESDKYQRVNQFFLSDEWKHFEKIVKS